MARLIRNAFSTLIIAVFVFGTAGCVKAQGFFDNPLAGKDAPNFVQETLKGGKSSLNDLIKGKKSIIFFWATWCPHCREQIMALNAKKNELKKQNIAVCLVDIAESRGVVQRFMESQNLDFPVFLDAENEVAEMYQVVGVPTVVFIGVDGKVRDELHVFPDEYLDILK